MMITVNLRPGQKRKAAGGGPKQFVDGLKALGTRVKDPFLETRGEELAVGIERAAAFLQSASRSAGGISRLWLTGGGGRIPGLNKVLADRLRLPVELANPLARLSVAEGVFSTMNMDEVSPLLMLPIGLALRSAA